MRRSLHFVPGGQEKMIAKALTLPADGLILDLEDAVPPPLKPATRPIVRRWLETLDFGGRERWVRMNPIFTEHAVPDLEETIAARPDGYLVPKPRTADDVRRIAAQLERLEEKHGLPFGSTELILIATETPQGLLNIGEVAAASKRIVAISWGVEDLSAAMGLPRVRDDAGRYLDIPRYARVMCAVAAAASGVEALDTVYTDIPDLEGLRRECRDGVAMGFAGKISIHPSQIEVINQEFTPSKADAEDALALIAAFEEHAKKGAGAFTWKRSHDGPAASHAREEDRRAGAPGGRDLKKRGLTPRRAAVVMATILIVSAVVFALPVGRRPLDNQDEARYSLLARKAVESGYWILPRIRGEVYLNKPPLYFWTVAVFALPWGVVTDANAPIASVVSALAGLLAVFAIGRLLWGAPAGLAAALALATSPFYFFMAHQVLTDMMLTAWMAWALYFYLAACRAAHPLRPMLGFYLCVAGALASKGPAALMALAAVVAASLAVDGVRSLGRLKLPLGLALIVVTALPWLLPYLLQRERSYGHAVVMTDYLGWYFRSAVTSRLEAVAGHLARFLPWGFFILPAAVWWIRVRDADRRRILVWAATLIVLLSLSGEQRARYFLPLWPVFALLVADFFVGAGERARGMLTGAAVVYLILMMGTGAFVLWGTASGPDAVFLPVAAWERYVVAGGLVAGSALALLSLRVDHGGLAASAWIALGLGVALAVTAHGYPPRFARDHDYPGVAKRIAPLLDPAQPLLAYPDANLAWDFYLRSTVSEVRSPGEATALLAAPPKSRLLLRADDWQRLKAQADAGWKVLDEGQVGRRRFVLVGS